MILRQREAEKERETEGGRGVESEGREGRDGGECKSIGERCWCVLGAEAINWHNNHSAARA